MSRLTLVTDTRIIRENAGVIRGLIDKRAKMLCVVKADAYGHGALKTAQALYDIADAYAVAVPEEGKELRLGGIDKMIVVLGSAACGESALISVECGLSQAVSKPEDIERLERICADVSKNCRVHLKIDTGMSRTGARDGQTLDKMLSMLKQSKCLELEGMFTHFCVADTDEDFTRLQFERFLTAREKVRAAGFAPICHAAASTAMLNNEYALDMVRAGIALYGTGVEALAGRIRPGQRLIAHPIAFRTILPGDTVGYGRHFTAKRETRVMTVPCGYGDGYPRILSGKADVIVCGKRAPIIGNVCMDMLMADVTDIPEADYDSTVTLLGDGITPDELAEKAQTIPYEIMLGFSNRVERKWET